MIISSLIGVAMCTASMFGQIADNIPEVGAAIVILLVWLNRYLVACKQIYF
jgi:hypothetical protein